MGHDPLAWMSEEDTASQADPSLVETTESSTTDEHTTQPQQIEGATDVEIHPMNEEPTTTDDDSVETDTHDDIPFNNQWAKVNLPSVLTLAQLESMKNDLTQHMEHRVELIGNEVKRVDTASLQLLYAFMQHPDVTVSWVSPSVELRQAASFLGMSEHLNLPVYGEN